MAPYANASLCTIALGMKAAALTRSPAGADVPLCARLSVREVSGQMIAISSEHVPPRAA